MQIQIIKENIPEFVGSGHGSVYTLMVAPVQSHAGTGIVNFAIGNTEVCQNMGLIIWRVLNSCNAYSKGKPDPVRGSVALPGRIATIFTAGPVNPEEIMSHNIVKVNSRIVIIMIIIDHNARASVADRQTADFNIR